MQGLKALLITEDHKLRFFYKTIACKTGTLETSHSFAILGTAPIPCEYICVLEDALKSDQR